MGSRIPTLILGLTAAALVAAGCAAPGGGSDGWAGAPTSELAPTGMHLAGTTQPDAAAGAVVDGTGAVWTRGPWRLTRVDPASGEAATWDAADDPRFAVTWGLVGSSGSGVWLKDQQAARLFDGKRFAADLVVPAEQLHFFDDPEASSSLADVAEVGPGELWLALSGGAPGSGQSAPPVAGRVVRFRDGQWSTVSDLGARQPNRLVVDAHGAPWLTLAPPGEPAQSDAAPGVLRWDGSAWVAPAADDPDYPQSAFTLASAPDGSVYVLDLLQGEMTLLRFDGTSWSTVATDVGEHTGESMSGDALSADATGAWIAGVTGLAHVTPDGVWQDFGSEQGLDLPLGTLPDVVVSGERVLARTAAGMAALSGGQFAPLWADDAAAVRTAGGLLAVSADEVWALVERPGERVEVPGGPEGLTRPPQGWSRYRDGTWTPVGGAANQGCPAALATDGAVWMTTDDGLVRWADGRADVVIAGLEECGVLAGPSGTMWVTDDGDVVGVAPDGTRTPIGRPEGAERAYLRAAGPDGTVWVETRCDIPTPSLVQWDGQAWQAVDAPDPDVWMFGIAVADDGAAWAMFTGEDPEDPSSGLSRYADGVWTTFPGWPGTVTPAPGGLACSMDDPEDGTAVNCYGAEGKVATFHVPPSTWAVSIGPDGSVWIIGDQVARLVEQAPSA